MTSDPRLVAACNTYAQVGTWIVLTVSGGSLILYGIGSVGENLETAGLPTFQGAILLFCLAVPISMPGAGGKQPRATGTALVVVALLIFAASLVIFRTIASWSLLTCSSMIGLTVLILAFPGRLRPMGQYTAFAAGSVALLSLVGHIYSVYGIDSTTGMRITTSVLGLALAAACLCRVPTEGIMAIVTSSQAGGVMARKMLTGTIAVPSLLGLLRLEGERWALYDTQRGVTILVVLITVAFMVMIGRYARHLNTTDRARMNAESGRETAERELAAQRMRAIRSDRLRSLGEMSAGMAHELNQPLLGVRGQAEHMLLGIDRGWSNEPEKLKEKLALIVGQADRMTHIIEHARLFAREAGRPETRPVNVNEVAEATAEFVGEQFRNRNITLSCRLTEQDLIVEANPYSLEEVLTNLLINARDATEDRQTREAGDTELNVILSTETRDGSVQISVQDEGTGIPAENMDRVFEPFFTTKDAERGTGLGLPVCKSIVEQHGGTIAIPHGKGPGTTVTVNLPLLKTQQ